MLTISTPGSIIARLYFRDQGASVIPGEAPGRLTNQAAYRPYQETASRSVRVARDSNANNASCSVRKT